jgi:signal transduction histidine kinase
MHDEPGLAKSVLPLVTPAINAAGLETVAATVLRLGESERGMAVFASAPGHATIVDQSFADAVAARISVTLEQEQTRRDARRVVADHELAISVASHDLINPLSTIQIGATALLDPEPLPTGRTRHVAELIQRSATWMQHILRDLLDRASLQVGRMELHRQRICVEQVIDVTHEIFAPLAEEHRVLFMCSSAKDVPEIDADPDRLLQVLSNLISNAIKFTPPGGRVELSVRAEPTDHAPADEGQPGPGARFIVRDTGKGIAAEELPHVFEWFWHSESAPPGSTGLGLSIAKALVEAHGGELQVESGKGQGTRFWFTLPGVG